MVIKKKKSVKLVILLVQLVLVFLKINVNLVLLILSSFNNILKVLIVPLTPPLTIILLNV